MKHKIRLAGKLPALLLASALLAGCAKTVYVPVETASVRTDTLRLERLRTDSVFVRDSVCVLVSGDTVRIERFRDRWRDRVLYRDSVVVRTDSVRVAVPYPVETIREVNRLRWWQPPLMWAGGAALLLAIGLAGGWLRGRR